MTLPQEKALVDAKQAAAFLDVKQATLYSYVSRGLLKRVQGRGRTNLYSVEDLERLKSKSQARSGHAAVANTALRWGQPSIESKITYFSSDEPHYRGESAIHMARSGQTFSSVCALLWDLDGEFPPSLWIDNGSSLDVALLVKHCGLQAEYVDVMRLAVALIAANEPHARSFSLEREWQAGASLMLQLTRLCAFHRGEGALLTKSPFKSLPEHILFAMLGKVDSYAAQAINQALILCADHGLNNSAFTARVIASTQADLYACIAGAIGSLSGPLHGGMCNRVEAFFDEVIQKGSAAKAIQSRFNRGDLVPGFYAHPLYSTRDPRATVLLESAYQFDENSEFIHLAKEAECVMEDAQQSKASVDFALVVLCKALSLPSGAAIALFTIGRCAGWIAHIQEQRQLAYLLRPTAKYVGKHANSKD